MQDANLYIPHDDTEAYAEFGVRHALTLPDPKSSPTRWLREFFEAFVGGYFVCWFWLQLVEVLL